MDINKIDENIWDENILFYRILKSLIKSKISPTKLSEFNILVERNINKTIAYNSWIELIRPFINGKQKNGDNSDDLCELLELNLNNSETFINLLNFALTLLQLKDLLWEEVKMFNENRFKNKMVLIDDSLSLKYDINSLELPYGFRVIFALIIDILLRVENNNTTFLLNSSNNILIKLNNQIQYLSKNSNLNSASVFNLIINESVNQSIKTTAGYSYETRVKEKFASFPNVTLTGHSHDSKINSVEYDLIANYNSYKIGVSAKRTLRERYKQNLEDITSLDVDAMIVVTLGLDLTESTMNNILQKEGQYILVSQEIYNSKEFLQNSPKVFSSIDFNFSKLNFN